MAIISIANYRMDFFITPENRVGISTLFSGVTKKIHPVIFIANLILAISTIAHVYFTWFCRWSMMLKLTYQQYLLIGGKFLHIVLCKINTTKTIIDCDSFRWASITRPNYKRLQDKITRSLRLWNASTKSPY